MLGLTDMTKQLTSRKHFPLLRAHLYNYLTKYLLLVSKGVKVIYLSIMNSIN